MEDWERQELSFQNQYPWIQLNGNDREESETLVAVLALGLLTALEEDAISLEAAESRLFNISTLEHLRRNNFSETLLGIIDAGENLSVFLEINPDTYRKIIEKTKGSCLTLLRSVPSQKRSDVSLAWIEQRRT